MMQFLCFLDDGGKAGRTVSMSSRFLLVLCKMVNVVLPFVALLLLSQVLLLLSLLYHSASGILRHIKRR